MNRNLWFFVGGVVAGAVGSVLYARHKDKIKPATARMVARAMQLREKAMDYAAKTREHAEDIVAEAKHINEAAAQGEA